jgi:serine/threonine protein kinase
MTSSSRTSSQQRLNELFEAAVLLAPADRRAFLEEVCAGDPRLSLEVQALLSREPSLSPLGAQDRQRISGVFHAAFALPREDRRAFLDRACASRPEDRREVELLLGQAESSVAAPLAEKSPPDETRVGSATDQDGRSQAGSPSPPARHLQQEEAGASPFVDRFVGRRVREYEILRKLGEGGMGVVYLALDTRLQKQIAIKVVRPDFAGNAEYRKRLVSEAQLAARLSHPNIATVHALFDEGADIFIVSEFVPGPSLREVVSRGPLPYARLVRVFTSIARALESAHAKGIIHRDLKPDNVLLAEDDTPMIVDFGLAKSTRAILVSTRMASESGTHAGTPAYMAPEQVEDRPGQPLDFRCDLFAFGVTLYEAATGINPFEGRSLFTTLENIKRIEPATLGRPGTDLGQLDGIVQRCLRKNPADRYESTRDLVQDLERLRPSTVSIPPRPPVVASRTWWEVHQLALSLFYAASLTLLWLVHPLARPLWASRALAFAALAGGALLIGMRSHFWFASRQRLSTLGRTRALYRRAVRWADWAFSGTFATMTALLLYVDRPGPAAPLLIIAAVNVVVFFVVEPASEADAFPDDHSLADPPAMRPPSGPSPSGPQV